MADKYKTPSLRYPGGKSKVAKKIIAKMPPHSTYVEPFSGAAHVFFKKDKANKNVLNDLNKNLIGFYKDLKGKKICCNIKPSKDKFNKIRDKDNKTFCDYLYLNKNSYGGKHVFDGKPSYGYQDRKKSHISNLCIDGSKLEKVKLTTKDFKDSIKQNDSKDTLFYVDPPYVEANKNECIYGKNNCGVSPSEVAKALKSIKGKAIISYDDHPEVRKAFKGFKIENLGVPYSIRRTIKGKQQGIKKELLIKNYKCKRTKDGVKCEKIKKHN